MGNEYINNAGVFLVQTVFSLVILIVMLRLLLQMMRADFRNPVAEFLVKVTNPMLRPLRRFIPGIAGIDMASVVLLILLQMTELFVVTFIVGQTLPWGSLVILSVAELLGLVLNVFLFSILIQVIISWINPGLHNPVTSLLYSLNEPLLSRARRLIPPISGFDLSPILAMLLLQLMSMLLVAPIRGMAFGGG